jgi:hypothetical protein
VQGLTLSILAGVGDGNMVARLRRTRRLKHIATYVFVLSAACGLVIIEDGGVAATPVSPSRQLSALNEHACHISVDRSASGSPAASEWIESSEEKKEEERHRKQRDNTESHSREVTVCTYCARGLQASNKAPPTCARLESVVLRL